MPRCRGQKRATTMPPPLAAPEPRDEDRLLSVRVEAADELAPALRAPLRGGEARAGELLETALGRRHGCAIAGVEFVSGVAGVVHHNLARHAGLLPSLHACRPHAISRSIPAFFMTLRRAAAIRACGLDR